jgi:hypothetical protein
MDWDLLQNGLAVIAKHHTKAYLTKSLVEGCKIKYHHLEQGKDVNNAFCDKHRVAVVIAHASSA